MDPMLPDRVMFAKDPAGYSISAWTRWAMIASVNGKAIDPERPPIAEDLKDPVLWLAQAEAMSQAAVTLIKAEPSFEHMPVPMRGICDSQYCAVSMMLVGYSLEICLKAMRILKDGIGTYTQAEKQFFHHRLHELAEFVPGLDEKDRAILRMLTHFTMWAGRYPDPGHAHVGKHEEIYGLSEQHEICARDVFGLAARVMQNASRLVETWNPA